MNPLRNIAGISWDAITPIATDAAMNIKSFADQSITTLTGGFLGSFIECFRGGCFTDRHRNYQYGALN